MSRKKLRTRRSSPLRHRRRRSSSSRKGRGKRRLSKRHSYTRATKYRSSHSRPLLNDSSIRDLWELNRGFRAPITNEITVHERTACWSLVAIWAAYLTGMPVEELQTHGPLIYEKLLTIRGEEEKMPVVLLRLTSDRVLFKPSKPPTFQEVWFELDEKKKKADIYTGKVPVGDKTVVTDGSWWMTLAKRMYGDWHAMFIQLKEFAQSNDEIVRQRVIRGKEIDPTKMFLTAGEFLVVETIGHYSIVYCNESTSYTLIDNTYKYGILPFCNALDVLKILNQAIKVFEFKKREYVTTGFPIKRDAEDDLK